MLPKKGSVKGIGELRNLGLACVPPWTASRLRWDLVKLFLRGYQQRVTSFAAGNYGDNGAMTLVAKDSLSFFCAFIGKCKR